MSNHHTAVKEIIKAFSGKEEIIAIQRPFLQFMGSCEGALFLSQVIYYSDKGDQTGWFYKTYAQWKDEICLSEYQVRKAAKQLQERGFLETDVRKVNGNPVLHYRLDFAKFSESFLKFLQERNLKNSRNEPEKTQGTSIHTTITYNDYIHRELETPIVPLQQAKTFPTEPATEPASDLLTSCQAGALSKREKKNAAAPAPDFEKFLALWRLYAPPHWPKANSLGSSREKSLRRLISDFGQEESLRIFEDALRYAQQDSWCLNPDHRLTMDNFLSNGKPLQWAEKWRSRRQSAGQPQSEYELAVSRLRSVGFWDEAKNAPVANPVMQPNWSERKRKEILKDVAFVQQNHPHCIDVVVQEVGHE